MDFFDRLEKAVNEVLGQRGEAKVQFNPYRVFVDYYYPAPDGDTVRSRVYIGPRHRSEVNARAAASVISTFSIQELEQAMADESTYCSGIYRFEVFVERD